MVSQCGAGAEDVHLNLRLAHPRDVADFLVAVAFVVAQQHGVALCFGQGGQGLVQDVVDVRVGALGASFAGRGEVFDARKMLSLPDFVNHGVVGGGEEVGFRLGKVHRLDLFPNAGKALLHHVLGLLAVAEAREREAEKPVGIKLHALVVLTSVHLLQR